MKRTIIATLVAITLAGGSVAHANTPGGEVEQTTQRTWQAGIKAGVLMGGEVTVDYGEAFDVGTESGPALLLTVDALTSEKLSLGGFLFYADVEDEFGMGVSVATIGGTIKGRYKSGELEIRPGMALGYQTLTAQDDDETSTTGLDVGGFVEFAKPMGRQELLLEVGFITQPAGGNTDIDLTFGPIFYLTAGIGFGN